LCEFGAVLASKTVTQNEKEKVEINMTTIKASFDTTTLEGQMKVFNAQNGASISMKDVPENTRIVATGVMQYAETVESYGNGSQEAVVTVVFAEDGTSYAGVSDTVAKAGDKLIDFIMNTGIQTFNVKIVKQKSKAGREFLNLQLV
jgi:7-cyano-7-deazaguanine synthase in queuosine biosynthesis